MMMRGALAAVAVLAALAAAPAAAQDPAPGWMSYAVGTNPDGSTARLTSIEARWKVLNNPVQGGAFFSPWLGQDTTDNLNLLQPVNPWLGNSWAIYNEYFQWSPEHNQDSAQASTSPGNTLHGKVVYNEGQQSYTLTQTDETAGQSVHMTIPVQQNQDGSYKNYTIVYLVFEKVWPCTQYPTNNEIVFYDIKVEYDNKPVTPNWKTAVKDPNCQFQAKVLNSTAVQMTWSSSAADSAPLETYKNLDLLSVEDRKAVYAAHGREYPHQG